MSRTIERVETSWADLLAAIDGIPEDRLSEPGAAADWSVKDVLAHVAWWDGRAIRTVEQALNAESDVSDIGLDVDGINENVHAERSNWSVARMLDELHGTHARLLTALRQHPDLDPEIVKDDTYEHYDEHAADIRAWRERAGI